ncbi:MAG: LysR substrate-binding domain-containing protein [Spongiibacteraceae bacterium]
MDKLDSIAVFLSVVETGSFSAAGRKLGMPLATVSRKVSDLEAHLNARLLNRSTRLLTLTEPGRDYAAVCKRILDDLSEADRAITGEYTVPKGELIITAPLVFGRLHVLPVITEFLAAYPEVDVRLIQSDRVVHLLEDHIDLAVRIGELPDSSMQATRVGTIRRVVCASPNYLATHAALQHPTQLSDHACITFDALMSSTAWEFTLDGATTAIPVRSRLIVNTAEAAIDAAIAGVGVTRVLSYQMQAASAAKQLQPVLQSFEPASTPVNLVFSQQRRLPLKLRAFIDFAAPRLRDRLR